MFEIFSTFEIFVHSRMVLENSLRLKYSSAEPFRACPNISRDYGITLSTTEPILVGPIACYIIVIVIAIVLCHPAIKLTRAMIYLQEAHFSVYTHQVYQGSSLFVPLVRLNTLGKDSQL